VTTHVLTQLTYVGMAVLIGMGSSLQVTLVSAMGRLRAPLEATWVSLMATVLGVAVLMAWRSTNGAGLALPGPFDRWPLLAAAAVLAGTALVLTARGIAPYFAATGLLAIPLLVGAGFLGPRIGVALFVSAMISGQIIGAVVLDHFGAFGLPVHRVDLMRLAGIGALALGVLLVRGVK
jgi:uncharacterized membrane protein YdcZ (DUF606 family)